MRDTKDLVIKSGRNRADKTPLVQLILQLVSNEVMMTLLNEQKKDLPCVTQICLRNSWPQDAIGGQYSGMVNTLP